MIPRGPVQFEENGALDYTDGYLDKIRRWRTVAMDQARQFRDLCPEVSRLKTYTKYIEGDQIGQFGRRPMHQSKFYLNKTGSSRVNHLALVTDSRPDIEIKSIIPEYEGYTNILNDVISQEWSNLDLDIRLAIAADIAAVTGTGFWKIGGGAPGMMRVTPCGPDMVMPIQPGWDIQESAAVVHSTWKSLAAMSQKYPQFRDRFEKQSSKSNGSGTRFVKPDHMDDVTWQGTAPAMKVLMGKRTDFEGFKTLFPDPFSVLEVSEFYVDDYSVNESSQRVLVAGTGMALDKHNWWYYVEPGERLYPRKRLIKFIGNEVVYDGPSPYWHGLYPFATLRLNPVFWSFWGLSKYRDILPVNSAINDIIGGVLDTIKKALNPITIARNNSVSQESWRSFFPNAPGAKLMLDGFNSNPQNDIRFSDPPQLPAYVFQILAQYLGPEFDKMTGIIDTAAMGGKRQVPGGDTLEQMRDSLQTPLRLEGRMIEIMVRDAGMQAISNIFQFYSPQRIKELTGKVPLPAFLGDSSSLLPKGFEQSQNRFDFYRKFPIKVTPGSMHGGAKDRRKLMAMNLFQMGALSLDKLHEELEISDPQIKEERAQMQAMAMQQGGQGSQIRMSRGQRNGSPV